MMLRQLIAILERYPAANAVRVGIGSPHSYRGYYSELAFEPERDTTVGAMLTAARSALGATYQGYKGGDYTMGEYTDVYLTEYGMTGEMLSRATLYAMLGDSESFWQALSSPSDGDEP